MDKRREHGQYWPAHRTDAGGDTPAPADNGKVDRVDLGTLPADATASEMRTAIRNIQNAMRPLATALAAALCGFVMAQTAPWDGLRGGVHVVTNEQDAVAMEEIARATNGIPAEIAAATNGIPAQIAAATNGIPAEIAAATNGLPERIAAVTNELSAYALKTQIPDIPDLSPYALKSEVPPAPDLTGYATKYEVGLATNEIPARIAAATNGLPEKISAATNGIPAKIAAATNGIPAAIAAATNGIPERIAAATNALDKSLAPAIATTSNALAKATADLAQKVDGLAMAAADSNTTYRLMSPDGGIYQDATGTVWRLRHLMAPGLFRLDTVQYFTNGVMAAETNELPGVEWTLWEGYDNGTWEMLAGESGTEEDVGACYREWRDFTNHVAAADMEDMTKFYYLAQLVVAGEEYELQYDGGISESQITLEWPMTEPYKTRYLNFSRTNVTASVWTPIDRVMYASEKEKFISTNDVKAIVTNEVELGYRWIWVGGGDWGQPYYENGRWHCDTMDGGTSEETDINAASLTFYRWEEEDEQEHIYTANRIQISRNALGLARLSDLPTLTNGIPEAIGSKASTNEVKLLPVYGGNGEKMTRWRIFRDGVEVTTQVQQPEYYEGEWQVELIEGDMGPSEYPMGNGEEKNISWTGEYEDTDYGITGVSYSATRSENAIVGYTLGGQENKVLAATGITNGVATAAAIGKAAAASSNYVDAVNATINTSLSAISNKAPAVADTILGVRWVLKATNGVIYAEVEQQ